MRQVVAVELDFRKEVYKLLLELQLCRGEVVVAVGSQTSVDVGLLAIEAHRTVTARLLGDVHTDEQVAALVLVGVVERHNHVVAVSSVKATLIDHCGTIKAEVGLRGVLVFSNLLHKHRRRADIGVLRARLDVEGQLIDGLARQTGQQGLGHNEFTLLIGTGKDAVHWQASVIVCPVVDGIF